MERISLSGDGVKYLVFEGGGGLGVVYLGAIDALEGVLGRQPKLAGSPHVNIPRRLFPINSEGPIESRPFRGVCGASAGAITAFMLAIGMDSYEIDETLSELHNVIFDLGDPKGSFEKWSAAENFFDAPNAREYSEKCVNYLLLLMMLFGFQRGGLGETHNLLIGV